MTARIAFDSLTNGGTDTIAFRMGPVGTLVSYANAYYPYQSLAYTRNGFYIRMSTGDSSGKFIAGVDNGGTRTETATNFGANAGVTIDTLVCFTLLIDAGQGRINYWVRKDGSASYTLIGQFTGSQLPSRKRFAALEFEHGSSYDAGEKRNILYDYIGYSMTTKAQR